MSKTAKLSDQHVSEIAQQVGTHLKQAGHGTQPATASGSTRTTKGVFLWGAASGIAVMLAAPLLRPAARSAIKAGIKVGRQAKEAGMSWKEELEDITAEARAELDRETPPEDISSKS